MDAHSEKIRSYNMSQIKNKNTKPEEVVRKYLFNRGLRYRKNDSRLPGHPDIVFPKYKTVVFVNGCFWHVHDNCKYFKWPQNNQEFWKNKLLQNKTRDEQKQCELQKMGWNVLVIWECELKKQDRDVRLAELYSEIVQNIFNNRSC